MAVLSQSTVDRSVLGVHPDDLELDRYPSFFQSLIGGQRSSEEDDDYVKAG